MPTRATGSTGAAPPGPSFNPPKGAFTGGAADAPKASLVYLLNVNGRSALFTGDIQQSQATDVADLLPSLVNGQPIDIFLATHHGSREGSIKELLDVIRPCWAVISTG